MRKVRKGDEIPIKNLTSDPARIRQKGTTRNSTLRKIRKKVTQLDGWLGSKVGSDVNPNVIVARIYSFIDWYMELAINDNLVCAKGCANCCGHGVAIEVSAMEANYINSNTKYKANDLKMSTMRLGDDCEGYCPLLDQEKGICSVYEYRPLACRIFGTYDHYRYCESVDIPHAVHSFKSQPYLGLLNENLVEWSRGSGYAAHADIRDWFGDE